MANEDSMSWLIDLEYTAWHDLGLPFGDNLKVSAGGSRWA